MPQTDWKPDVPLEERKRKLLAEGALFRIGIMQARGTVRANLNAESLAKGALNRIVGAVSATFSGTLSGKGGNLQSLSPLLIGGISLLSKRYLRKPLLYGAVISAGGAFAYYLTRRKDRQQGVAAEEASTPDGE